MVNLNIKKISEPLIPMAISWSNDYDGKYGEIIDMSQAVPSYPPHPKLIEEFIKGRLLIYHHNFYFCNFKPVPEIRLI